MSQENVDIARSSIDAYNRSDIESILEVATADFELDLSRAAGPLIGVYGRDRIEAFWAEITDSWESARIEPHDFIEAGEHVVVPWTMHLTGRDGIEVQARVTWVWTFRDGAVERLTMYQELDDALRAVGLAS
jgi:ketosteroid isomerase-like protein